MQWALRYIRWIPSMAWMLIISYWSSQSSLPIDNTPAPKDLLHKISHVGAFVVLVALNRWALGEAPRAALWAWLLTTVFGAVDEWHQSFTPGREPALRDWFLDTAAAAAAAPVADRVMHACWPWRSEKLATGPVPDLARAAAGRDPAVSSGAASSSEDGASI